MVVVLAACTEPSPERPTNAILISIDTLRPDHLGCYGYDRPTSPSLDRLASEGVLFENISSTAPWTLPAHASILTGRYPNRHGVTFYDTRLSDDIPTLAEHLGGNGFKTAAIVNSYDLSQRYGLARGFEHFEYVRELTRSAKPSGVENRALGWIAKQTHEPFFLFVHYYDVHSDYVSEPHYERQFVRTEERVANGETVQLRRFCEGKLKLSEHDAEHLRDLYDAGIRQLDEGIDRLVEALRSRGLLDTTLIVITSDHGEEFLEHGSVLHGRTQFDEVIRVPLIVRGPGIPAGRRISEIGSLVDLAPTLFAALGVSPPAGMDGIDLSPLWRAAASEASERLVFSEADHGSEVRDNKWAARFKSHRDSTRAVRNARFKLHHDRVSGTWRLYDLQGDPGELRDVSDAQPAVARALRESLEDYMAVGVSGKTIEELTPEEIEHLRSLGYLTPESD